MFLDLHEGILEVFADAQRAWSDRREAALEGLRALFQARRNERQRDYRKRHQQNVSADIRARRAAAPVWSPPRPRVWFVDCKRCGSLVEQREGCKTPVNHPCTARRG